MSTSSLTLLLASWRLSIATAISLSVISFRPIKSEANPAALAAPAACATGVGCILVGTAVVGGVLVYVWQNRNTGERYRVPASSGYDANQTARRRKRDRAVQGQMAIPGVQPGARKRSAVTTLDECIKANRGKTGWDWQKQNGRYGKNTAGTQLGLCVYAN